MVQGQVFLKRREDGGWGVGTFPIKFFQGLSFLHLEITLWKIVIYLKKKYFFYAIIIL